MGSIGSAPPDCYRRVSKDLERMNGGRSYSVAIALSIACHALIAAGIAWAPRPADPRMDIPDVTFELATEPLPPPEEEPQVAPEPREPIPPAASAIREPVRRAPSETPTSQAPPAEGSSVTMETSPEPVPEPSTPSTETDTQRRRRLALALDPSAVTRGTIDFGTMADRDPGFDGTGHRDLPRGAAGVDRRGRGAELDRIFAAEIASSGPTSRRPPPELRRSSDGGYDWSGPRVSAHVAPDGTVSFQDQGPVQGRGVSASFSFDVSEAVMGARGQDVHRAEREWFLRETETLRDGLETTYRRQLAASGARRVRAELSRIWGASGLSPIRKRREILDFYADLDEGALGDSARRVVAEFVRTYLPADSVHAFTAEELARFNRGRAEGQRLEPYDDASAPEDVDP